MVFFLSVTSPLCSMNKYIDTIISQNTPQFFMHNMYNISHDILYILCMKLCCVLTDNYINILMVYLMIHSTAIITSQRMICRVNGVLISPYPDQEVNKLQGQKILIFIYPTYNHNWRNISTIYIYNKTSIKRNILTIKQNTSGSGSA